MRLLDCLGDGENVPVAFLNVGSKVVRGAGSIGVSIYQW